MESSQPTLFGSTAEGHRSGGDNLAHYIHGQNCWDTFYLSCNFDHEKSCIDNSPPLLLLNVVLTTKRSLYNRQILKSTLSEGRGEGIHLHDLVLASMQENGEICMHFVFVSMGFVHDCSCMDNGKSWET